MLRLYWQLPRCAALRDRNHWRISRHATLWLQKLSRICIALISFVWAPALRPRSAPLGSARLPLLLALRRVGGSAVLLLPGPPAAAAALGAPSSLHTCFRAALLLLGGRGASLVPLGVGARPRRPVPPLPPSSPPLGGVPGWCRGRRRSLLARPRVVPRGVSSAAPVERRRAAPSWLVLAHLRIRGGVMAALLVVLVVVILLLLAVAGPPAPVVPASAARLRLRRLLVRARLVDGRQGGGAALALARPAGGRGSLEGRRFSSTENSQPNEVIWRSRKEENQHEVERKGKRLKTAKSRMLIKTC